MFLTPWLYKVHKNVLLLFISVKVIRRQHTITTRGIKHTEVVYKKKTSVFSVILKSLYYWHLFSPSTCKILMLHVFKISFPPPTACCLLGIRIYLIEEMYLGKTQK